MMQPPAVISKRSEKSRVAEDAFLGADDGCMRSLPLVEMTAGEGRDDGGGKGDEAGEGRDSRDAPPREIIVFTRHHTL